MMPWAPGAVRVVVVGGGIAGLVAARELEGARRGGARIDWRLFEAAPRPGGKVASERVDGYLLESGPDSFAHRPAALDLVRELGLAGRLTAPEPGRDTLFVLRRGRLLALPAGMHLMVPSRLGPFLRSPLLSPRGRLRLLLDLVLPARVGDEEESVGGFLARRLGREALAVLGEPLLAGIHATPPGELSLQASFPHLAALEQRHRSLLLAARAARRAAGPQPPPTRVGLAGGIGELVDALVARLDPHRLRLATAARALVHDGNGLGVELDGERIEADAVVLALPAGHAAELWAADPGLAAALARQRCSSTCNLYLGFPRGQVAHPLDGVGFLVPPGENLLLAAATFASSKLPGRAPAGHVLVRAFSRHHEGAAEELARRIERELREILGIRGEPTLRRLVATPRSNPQYRLGHAAWVAEVERLLPPGVTLCGSSFHGVGLPECVASGQRAAARVLTALGDAAPRAAATALGAAPRAVAGEQAAALGA